MRGLKKAIIELLIFLMIVPLASIPIPVKAATAAAAPKVVQPLVIDGVTVPKSGKVEIESKRTATSKTYLKSDGMKELQVFDEPINFVTSPNKFAEIDSSLVQKTVPTSSSKIYQNKANSFSVSLGEKLFDSGASISQGKNTVSFKPVQTLSTAVLSTTPTIGRTVIPTLVAPTPNQIAITQNSVANSDTSGNINYKYYSTNKGLKEEIELKKYIGQKTFNFDLDIQNVYFAPKDGGYAFYDNTTKKQVFFIPPSFAYDQNKNNPALADTAYSYDVTTEILKNGNKYLLKLTPDDAWLRDPKRVYPVTIDPTIYPSQGTDNDDTYVQQVCHTDRCMAYDQALLWVGYVKTPNKKWTIMYLPFNGPDSLGDRVIVDSANVNIYQTKNIGNHGLLGRMVNNFAPTGTYWDNQPGVSGQYIYNQNSSTGWINMDVTGLAKNWYEDKIQGYKPGYIAFYDDTMGDGTTDEHYRQFFAQNYNNESNKPNLTISYRSYNAGYSFNGVHDSKVYATNHFEVNVTNTGQDFPLHVSDTFLRVYYTNNTTNNSETRDYSLTRDIGNGETSAIPIGYDFPIPGNWTIQTNLFHSWLGAFDSHGVVMGAIVLNVSDYPQYSAQYSPENRPTMSAGSSYDVGINIKNLSNTLWSAGSYGIGYHLIDNESGKEIGTVTTPFPRDVAQAWTEDSINVRANVTAPVKAGNYTLKWDLSTPTGWYSAKGVATSDQQIVVSAPSFSSVAHLGTEDYYPMAGPVDLSTGSLTYSTTDASVSTVAGDLTTGRTYNSNSYATGYQSNSAGYVTSWLVNGPYYEDNIDNRFNTSYLSEANIKPSKGLVSNNRVWSETSSQDNQPIIDLIKSYNGLGFQNTDNMSTYASTYVFSPTDRATQLKMGSDDGIKVWLNGAMVYSNNITRGVTLDSDTASINLKKGWNRLLVKITQGTGGVGFAIRFCDSQGNPFSDLSYTLNNPDVFQSVGALGLNWTPNFYERLDLSDGEYVYYKDGSGSVNVYQRQANGTYLKPAGSNLDLVKNNDGTYQIVDKSGVKFNFNTTGLIKNRIDPAGNSINYEYDTNGNCVKLTNKTKDGKGTRYLALAYNVDGTLAKIQNQLGTVLASYVYKDSRLVSVLDGGGDTISYTYDSSGRMLTNTDKLGNQISIEYQNGRVSKLCDPVKNCTGIGYLSGVANITDPLGRKSQITYNPVTKVLTGSTNANNESQKYEYDGNFNLTRTYPVLPSDNEFFYNIDYKYDQKNNLLSVTDPMGNKSAYEYDANSNLTKSTDPSGNVAVSTYDPVLNLMTTAKDPKGNTTTYKYDAYGHVVQEIDPEGSKGVSEYGAEGDVVSVTTPKGEKTTFQFDTVGRKTSQKTATGRTISFRYDAKGRLTEIVDPLSLSTKIDYDKNDNIVKQTNPRGFAKSYVYDQKSQLIKTTDEIGATVSYEFDAVGNQTKITDAKGKTINFDYDKLDQLTKVTDYRGKTAQIVYDRNGNVSKATDFNLQEFKQTVDKNGDPTLITSPDNSVSFKYDKNGNITEATSPTDSYKLSYDKNGNPVSVGSGATGTVTADYNADDTVKSVKTTDATVNLTYDSNNQVTAVSQTNNSNNATLTNRIVRDADGNLTNIQKANGENVFYTYDAGGRITSVATRNPGKALIKKINYQYDQASNITAMNDELAQTTIKYAYSPRNELIKEGSTDYSYDASGNRTKMSNGSNTTTYLYDENGDANRLIKSQNSASGDTSYTYDDNGNLTTETTAGKTTQYFYDSDGYFVKAVMPDGSVVEYTYDKVTKLRSTRVETKPDQTKSTIKFVWDTDRLVKETDENGVTLRLYTWGDDEKLISVSIPGSNNQLNTFYYLKNVKGDVLGMTDSTGKKVVDYSYDAWGNVTSSKTLSGSSIANLDQQNPRLYAGYWYDRTLGDYFMKVRLYDPSLGRFLSKDPLKSGIDAVDYNPYVYCGNNPVSRIDPSGKFWHIIIGAVIGAVVGATVDAIVQKVTTGSINWKEVGKSAIIGAVAGAVFAATCGTGTIGLGTLILAGAVSGGVAAGLGYTISNWGHMTVGGFVKNTLVGAAAGAVASVVAAGAAFALSKVASTVTSRFATPVGQNVSKLASEFEQTTLKNSTPINREEFAAFQQTHTYHPHAVDQMGDTSKFSRAITEEEVFATMRNGNKYWDSRYPGQSFYHDPETGIGVAKINDINQIRTAHADWTHISSTKVLIRLLK